MIRRTALLLAYFLATFAASAEETPAEPKSKDAPDYPVSCYPEDGATSLEHRVDVAFVIDKDGLTENVRVMRSTDPCFEEASIFAVRSWTYEPRRVDGRARPQEDMEATFIFAFQLADPQLETGNPIIETESRALVFDARPKKRARPNYPDRCYRGAYQDERVLVRFDVTTAGTTRNIEVVESSNDCFNDAALESVDTWQYEPKTIDGVPTDRVGVETAIVFHSYWSDVRPENVIRPVTARRFNHARRLVRQKKPEKALSVLENLDAKFGDTLTQAELTEFHRVRGLARLEVKDYEGALDDLRTARRLGAHDAGGELTKIIDRLETALGVQPEQSDTASNNENARSE